ncbi:MAG: BamA/TamA family outer membrane protein [Burkholderiaceae bacterium]|nr:BamA/TamA family outer membrane protein [Burkholderiaceae bacterium]
MLMKPTALVAMGTLALWLALASPARAGDEPPAQGFAALEAAGVRIGEIRIRAEDIFDTADPREDNGLFQLANKLHIQTRPEVIERALLFRRGELVSVRLIEETERLLRGNRYLYDVKFSPLQVHDGVVDIEVVTRDTWSLDAGGNASRAGGANAGGIHIAEYNLLGTGTTVTLGRSKNVDRTSTALGLRNSRAFGTWADLSYSHAVNSDGRRDAASVIRPFYALDARWAAGVSASKDDRIDSVYQAGSIQSEYRHRQTQAEAFAGWSQGLVDGWVHRYSLGVAVQDDAYLPEPGLVAPAVLPPDRKLRSPFVRWELTEDRFDRELNRNLIGRPEFFSLGLNATVQLGYATRSLGSSDNALLYTASVSRGFEFRAEDTLIAAAKLSGQFFDGQAHRQRLGVQAQYYRPQGPRWLLYAAGSLDTLTRPDPDEALVLGGEDGLRGYPLRYQSGTHRALFTLEERFYTDLYVWRLFRVGGAAFVDAGRAWGGEMTNATNPGWLANAGVGLRIVNARSAFSNVLHLDIAMPLNSAPDVKRTQFLVKTRTSF